MDDKTRLAMLQILEERYERKSVIIAALAMPMAKKDPLIPLKYAPEPGEPGLVSSIAPENHNASAPKA